MLRTYAPVVVILSVFLFAASANGQTVELVETAKITALDGAQGDAFGADVSVSGDVAVFGALGDDCSADPNDNCGSAYVYRFDWSSWSLEE